MSIYLHGLAAGKSGSTPIAISASSPCFVAIPFLMDWATQMAVCISLDKFRGSNFWIALRRGSRNHGPQKGVLLWCIQQLIVGACNVNLMTLDATNQNNHPVLPFVGPSRNRSKWSGILGRQSSAQSRPIYLSILTINRDCELQNRSIIDSPWWPCCWAEPRFKRF